MTAEPHPPTSSEARLLHDQLAALALLCSRDLGAEPGGAGLGASGPGYRISELARDKAAKSRDALLAPLTKQWGSVRRVALRDGQLREPWAFFATLAPEVHVWHTPDRWLALGVTSAPPARLLALVTTTAPPGTPAPAAETGETWALDADVPVPVTPDEVAQLLRTRIGGGQFDLWLKSPSGRAVSLLTNADRAMVVLFEGPDDPGEHALDPGAEGASGGFLLADGQIDAYPDADTVPLGEALRLVEHIVRTGTWPDDAPWMSDR
ncbi:hypothetical protein [Streptomyces indicus]|uniref:EspG family protein n=1 Tax=Streptomyces indicus TaxID=417292 RepID=A0A1G9A2L7_9ACTN|nr:hypothetical protein [Streptomyces indicus]SDK20640.1 hypothetical protein SAMN05421806_105286 [Streptomyces indicus]